jgi:hypothetical protein
LAGGILAGTAFSISGSTSAIAKGKDKDKDKGKAKVVKRSFPELLAAQGSTSDFFDQYDDAGNTIVDSPFPDYNGWSTPLSDPAHFAYVDYAGVMARFLAREEGIRIPTKVQGTVLERLLPDGRAEITVRMQTSSALAWIVKLDFDLTQDPLDFGYRPDELIANRSLRPALAQSRLTWVFRMEAPGLPLPDIGLVSYGDPPPGQLLAYDFRALAFGAVREEFNGDVPDGTRGMARIVNTGEGLDNPDCGDECYPEEVIEITPFGGKSSEREMASKGQRGSTRSAKGGKRQHRGRRGR